MKAVIHVVRYGSMDSLRITLTKIALRISYRKAVARRLHKKGSLIFVPSGLMHEVASQLASPKLASLFVDAQFDRMSEDWCLGKFSFPYPPSSAVFGGDAWERYQEFLQVGVANPS